MDIRKVGRFKFLTYYKFNLYEQIIPVSAIISFIINILQVFLILVINISGIFLFPHFSNKWILVTGQVFLMLMLLVKSYNEDLMKRQLFLQTQKQNLWDSIIEEFLPINLIVVKYDKTTQRLELTQTNKCARKKLRIVNDDHLQHFLDSTIVENSENTTQFFLNNQPQTQTNLDANINKTSHYQSGNLQYQSGNLQYQSGNLYYQSGNLQLQRQQSQIPQAAQGDISKSQNVNQSFYQQNVQKNNNDKFTLKKLLKNKLLKQLDQKNQPNSEKQQYELDRARKQSLADGQNGDTTVTNKNTNNTFENLESFTATFISENGRQKQLTIKVFTFCLVDNFAVLTIENESFKSKLKKQERKNEFYQTFYKDVMLRFEKNCKEIVVQLSQQLRYYGSNASQLSLKFKEILQIGYELLIINKNATDFIHQQEKQKNNHTSKRHTQIKKNGSFSNNKVGLNSSFGNKGMSFSYNNIGKQNIDICEFNPGKELFGWLNIFQSKIEHKKIHIFHEVDEKIGIITNDKNKFNQIIFNLLDNAVKFTPVNGKLAIVLKRNLLSQHLIDIHLMNSIEKDIDTFPLIRDIESTLQESTNYQSVNYNNMSYDEDYYNVLKKIKLGIPVSRKLIQLIGPNNHLIHKLKKNQIILHFQIFSDIRILKDNDEQGLSHFRPFSHARSRGETYTLDSKIPKFREKIHTLKQNVTSNQNLTTREFKTNPYISAQSTSSLPDMHLGQQLSFGQRINQRRSFNVQQSSSNDSKPISNQLSQQTHQKPLKPKHHTLISEQQYISQQPTSSQAATLQPTTSLPISSVQAHNKSISKSQPNQVSNQLIQIPTSSNLINNQQSSNQHIPSFVFSQNKLQSIQSHQTTLISLQSNQKQYQQPQLRNRFHSTNQSQEGNLSDRNQAQQEQDQKIRSLSNQYHSINQDPNSNFTLNIINILPSTNELVLDLNSPEFVNQSSYNSKVFTDTLLTNQNLNKTQPTSTTSLCTTQNKANKSILVKQKSNQIQAIFESANENNLENSNLNLFQQNQQDGFKTRNQLLNSQRQLLKENELDVIKLQKLTLSKIDSPRTKSLAQKNIANGTPKRKNFQKQIAERMYLNQEKINQNHINQSISSASGSKPPFSQKNSNSKKINISCPQTPETVRGLQLMKELNSPAEQSNIIGECYNSVYNSVESSSLRQLKINGISCEKSVNKYQLNFFPSSKNVGDDYEEPSKRDNLPYIPQKNANQDEDQQVSFDGWQNVDEQHNDSFQKWIEISTLRKYNELEFNQAFKILKDQQNSKQPFDIMIQISPDDKYSKDQYSKRSSNQNFTFIHENQQKYDE